MLQYAMYCRAARREEACQPLGTDSRPRHVKTLPGEAPGATGTWRRCAGGPGLPKFRWKSGAEKTELMGLRMEMFPGGPEGSGSIPVEKSAT
jgi:hypothetical protein